MADINEPKQQRERSPSFPFIPLQTAIDRLVAFDKYFGRHPAPTGKAGLAWDMKGQSSQSDQTLAALKAFGLIEYEGSSKERVAKLTNDGRTYLRAQQKHIKREILAHAALQPKLIAKFWDVWGSDRPPDPVCLDDLVLKHRFTENSAPLFLKVYDATITFTGLTESDKIPAVDNAEHEEDDNLDLQRVTPKVGDYIQWTSGGSDQFRIPRRVNWVSDDGSHVRVHGSPTGIKMTEVTVVDPPAPPVVGPADSGSGPAAGGNDDANDINVLLTGKRLQITADVDGKGLITLKKVLDQYEKILQLMSQPIENFKRPEIDGDE